MELFDEELGEVETAVGKVTTYARKLKLQEWIEVSVDERRLTLRFNGEACQEASQLDGCYVIKTDLAGNRDAGRGDSRPV